MFEIRICADDEVKLLYGDWATHVVTLLDPHHAIIWDPLNNNLVIGFDDIEGDQLDRTKPEQHHLEQVLDFTKDLTDMDRLVVHCRLGQSRSTAVAIAVLMQHGLPYEIAFNEIEKIRPVLHPNQQIVRLTDDIFSLNGEYVNYVIEWKKQKLQEMKTDLQKISKSDVDAMKKLLDLF
jgi:predicted protein tyrosine phosphatase